MEEKNYTQDYNIDSNISEANDLDEKTKANAKPLENFTISKDETIDSKEYIEKEDLKDIKDENISKDNNESVANIKKKQKNKKKSNSRFIDISSKGIFVLFYKITKNTTRNIMVIGFALILVVIIYIDRVIEARNLENNNLERKIERLEKMSIFQSNELLKYMQEEELQKNINSKNLNLKRLDTAPYVIEVKK